MPSSSDSSALRWLALGEPQRRRVYSYVSERGEPVTRSEVADGLGITRGLAAFHLDKLLEAGLLEADYRRPAQRRGPGAGRPAKRYRAAASEVTLSLPERRYELAGAILAQAIAEPVDGVPTPERARHVARERGVELGVSCASEGRPQQRLAELLQRLGYAPRQAPQRRLVLDNCPFHGVAEVARELVCGVNCALVDGLIDGLDAGADLHARLDPTAATCCVVVEPPGSSRP